LLRIRNKILERNMKNAIAMTALALGLTLGATQASFAQGAGGGGGQVDGGATMNSGQPKVSQQGAGTAMGKSGTGTTGSAMTKEDMKSDQMKKDHMKKGDMK
jgi:hypothetical protein